MKDKKNVTALLRGVDSRAGAKCVPCPHGPDDGKHHGCQVSICPYDEPHHVHHGVGTRIFDPHSFR